MYKSAKNILVSSILSIAFAGTMVAQPGTSQYDQWYRAKYGRPAASEQASVQASSASPDAAQTTVAVTAFEQWHRAKYGRPAATEQAPRVASTMAMPSMITAVVVSEKEVAANTPAEHKRIAQSYRDQAQAYLAEAKEHQAMIAFYVANPALAAKNQAGTVNHCEYFVVKFNAMASKSTELAQLHEQMATEAASK